MRLTGVTLCAFVLIVVTACSSSGDKKSDRSTKAEITSKAEHGACSLLTIDDVSHLYGTDLSVDTETSSDIQCSLLDGEGPQGATVLIGSVTTRQEFLALVTSGATAFVPNDDNGVEGADESLVWSDSPNIAAGAARVGGAIVTVRVLTVTPHEDLQMPADLLELIVPKLPSKPFSDSGEGGEALCSTIPVDDIRRAVASDTLEPTPMSDGCAFTDGTGINIIVTSQMGATPEQLDVQPTVTNVDGKDFEWMIEEVPDLGHGARWMLNPIDERSGELTALFGEKLVRVTSSANEPGPELKDRAIAVAEVVGAVGA